MIIILYHESFFGHIWCLQEFLCSLCEFALCFRFVPVETESDLEDEAASLHKSGDFIAGLVFMNTEPEIIAKRSVDGLTTPKHVQYKIRMDIDNVEQTMLLQEL